MIDNQTHKDFENALAKTQADAARHYALTQNQVYRAFWSREPQAIVDSLNSDFAKKLEWMHENTALGTAINAALAKAEYTDIHGVKHYTERCIVVMPEGFSCDGTQFVYADADTASDDDDQTNEPIPDDSYEYFSMQENNEPIEDDATHGN